MFKCKDQQMIYSLTACMEICGEVSIVNFTLIYPNKPSEISQWNLLVGEYLVWAWEGKKLMWQIYRRFEGSYWCECGGRSSCRKFEAIAREYDIV